MDNENKKFGLLMLAFMLLMSYMYIFDINSTIGWMVNAFSFALAVYIQIKPQAVNKIRLKWIEIGNSISKITSVVMIYIIYYLIFSTVGIFLKMIKRDELGLVKRSEGSYWKEVLVEDQISFEDQY